MIQIDDTTFIEEKTIASIRFFPAKFGEWVEISLIGGDNITRFLKKKHSKALKEKIIKLCSSN